MLSLHLSWHQMLLAELIQRSQATVELEQLAGSEAPQGGQEPLKCLYKMAEQSSPKNIPWKGQLQPSKQNSPTTEPQTSSCPCLSGANLTRSNWGIGWLPIRLIWAVV